MNMIQDGRQDIPAFFQGQPMLAVAIVHNRMAQAHIPEWEGLCLAQFALAVLAQDLALELKDILIASAENAGVFVLL